MNCLVKESLEKDGLTLKSGVALPEVGSDEVRIRVKATAVCGTDKSIYHSSSSEGIRREMLRYAEDDNSYTPIIVGHEFCGIVDELGSGVGADRFSDV
ncbi:MAG: alcohol dehydrogenase catalytic domain-containing protein, partial [Cyanobacteria bacterium HKST-UBA01]|nr:alcohol dehydrogenase catalytic domain-containing protein [Cyanobacteria bacterium HKST-UBA01]